MYHLPFIISGQEDSVIKNVSFANIQYEAPGGGTVEDRDVEMKNVREGYPMALAFGKKAPVYGMYAKWVDNFKLYNVDFMTVKEDARDAIKLENVTRFKHV